MKVTAYLKYKLFWDKGRGFTIYDCITEHGMTMDGGLYNYNDWYIGYLYGPDRVNEILNSHTYWEKMRLTPQQFLDHCRLVFPTNRIIVINNETKYIGKLSLDVDGKLDMELNKKII